MKFIRGVIHGYVVVASIIYLEMAVSAFFFGPGLTSSSLVSIPVALVGLSLLYFLKNPVVPLWGIHAVWWFSQIAEITYSRVEQVAQSVPPPFPSGEPIFHFAVPILSVTIPAQYRFYHLNWEVINPDDALRVSLNLIAIVGVVLVERIIRKGSDAANDHSDSSENSA